MQVRPLRARDRNRIQELINSAENFNQADRAVAMELIEDALLKQESSDYIVHVLEEEEGGEITAYVCFGKTPLTASTYDFYWMVIDPAKQRRGFGRMLFQHVEEQVRSRGGKLLMCETSSLEGYDRVVRLYEKLGYEFVARIKDFYRDGDDKLIYKKTLI